MVMRSSSHQRFSEDLPRCRACFSARPETAASQPHTDYSRVENVDRVESVAPLDSKQPYSTLMFSRKERKGRKRKNWLIVAMGSHSIGVASRPFSCRVPPLRHVAEFGKIRAEPHDGLLTDR